MTHRDVDRAVVDWLVGQEHRAGYLDDVLAVTSRTRQRSAWSFPGRWIPVDLTLRRVELPRSLQYLALLALLVLVATIILTIAGSSRELPAPFGPAANGLVAHGSPDGDIVTTDLATGQARRLVEGAATDASPAFSRDGTQVAFIRGVEGGVALYAVAVEGGEPRRLTTSAFPEINDEFAWSPDGSKIAFIAAGRALVVATAGTATPLELPRADAHTIDAVTWRPPNGAQLLIRGIADDGIRLYLVGVDGASAIAVTEPVDANVDEFVYIFPAFDPTGTRLIAQAEFPGGLVVLRLDPAGSQVLESTTVRVPAGFRTAFAPRLSPDGTRVAMAVFDRYVGHIAVAPLDDLADPVVTGPAFGNTSWGYDWSPDGTGILFWRTDSDFAWIFDPAGGEPQPLVLKGARDLDWQRVHAP